MITVTIKGAVGRCQACRPRPRKRAKVLQVELKVDSPQHRDSQSFSVCVDCAAKRLARFIDDDLTDAQIPF